jgi:CrcB protein
MDRSSWAVLGAVAAGSAVGGVARHLLTEAVVKVAGVGFPWGTIVVNVSGSLAIGVLSALADSLADWPPLWRHVAITGVLGGYTTFSAFSVQTVSLLQQGHTAAALLNVGVSVALGVVACWVGFAATIALAR